jgi:phosphatidate cytidylyltransferase
MSNLANRLLTAAVAAPIILGILYKLPPIATFALAGTAMLLAAWEFFGLSHSEDSFGRIFGTGTTLALYSVLLYTRFGEVHPNLTIVAFALIAPLALLVSLFRPERIRTAFLEIGASVLGPLYVGGLMATIALLRAVGTHTEGAGLVVLALMLAWMGDTGGYFVGKRFGGPKLYAAVSPNKTWSGAAGSLTGSLLGIVIAHFTFLPTFPLVPGLILGAVAGILGQLGDLCESVLKRSVGVKDSGAVLPGHGGFLDRIDAVVFASATLYLALRAGWITLGQ